MFGTVFRPVVRIDLRHASAGLRGATAREEIDRLVWREQVNFQPVHLLVNHVLQLPACHRPRNQELLPADVRDVGVAGLFAKERDTVRVLHENAPGCIEMRYGGSDHCTTLFGPCVDYVPLRGFTE